MRVRRRAVAVGAAVVALVGWHEVGRGPGAPPAVDPGPVPGPAVPPDAFAARVVAVVDGDTFEAVTAAGGEPVTARVIGVDTPETVKPGVPVRCFGPQASAFAKRLLPVGTVVWAAHEPGGDVDAYGRQLWDVWLPDGRFYEAVLVAAGAARAYPYPPQTRHAAVLRGLADAAQSQGRGLWGPPCRGDSFG